MKFISWLIIIIGFIFAGLVNTTSFKGKFWDESSEQAYALAENKYEYVVDYEISDIGKVFNIDSYDKDTVIKVVNNNEVFYYVSYQADFINMEKWKDPVFWSQTIVNTIYVSALYAVVLINKQADILSANGREIIKDNEVVGYEKNAIEKQYDILFDSEKKILPKKADYERYLTLVVNEEKITEIYISKLKTIKKRVYNLRFLLTIITFKLFNYKKSIKDIDIKIERLKNYKLSLYDLKRQVRLHVEIPIKTREITYDTVFDRVDISTNNVVEIGFSRQRETKKLIMKSPLTSFISIFTALLFFGNVAITWGEWLSTAMIMLTLLFASGMKIRSALNHAKNIMITLLKSLEKTNQMNLSFLLLSDEQLLDLKRMGEEQLALPEPIKVEKEQTEIDTEMNTEFEYSYDYK